MPVPFLSYSKHCPKISVYYSVLLSQLKATHHHVLSFIGLLKMYNCWHSAQETTESHPRGTTKAAVGQNALTGTVLLPEPSSTLAPSWLLQRLGLPFLLLFHGIPPSSWQRF